LSYVGDADAQPLEIHVFTKHYSQLTYLLFQENLAPHLISEKIILPSVEEELNSATTSVKKAQIVLLKVFLSLQSGFTESFHKLLKVMKTYGSNDLQKLTSMIESEVTGTSSVIETGLLSLFCNPKLLNFIHVFQEIW